MEVMYYFERAGIPADAFAEHFSDCLPQLMQKQLFSGTNGDRLDVINYAVLITDGNPDDLDDTVRKAVQSRIDGTHILVVGIGLNQRRALEYTGIASFPYTQTVIRAKRPRDLPSITEQLINTIINGQYI